MRGPAIGAEREGRIGRAERGDADFRNGLARGFRENAEAVEVRGLALVGGHAEGGVALGVLDQFIAFALGEFEIGSGHVVLVVDEVLVAFVVLAGRGCEPDRLQRLFIRLHGRRDGHRDGRCLGLHGLRSGRTCSVGLLENVREREGAVRGTDRADRVCVAVGPEGLQRIVEADLAAIVAPEVQRRIPAARHGDEIAGDLRLLDDAALALAIGRDLHVGDVEAAP